MANEITRYAYVDKVVAVNEEFIKAKIKELNPTWRDSTCVAKKMQIAVDKDCLVKINGKDSLLIKAEYGFIVDYEDMDISSMVALTDGVKVYAIIGY